MEPLKIVTSNVMAVSDITLSRVTLRMFAFLSGAANPAISAALAPVGWTKATLAEGHGLLRGFMDLAITGPSTKPALDAFATCEAWKNAGLVCARAMLQVTYPEQDAFLFHDFDRAAKGAQALFEVGVFLERRAELQKGADRKATRKADHGALEVIERTGTTSETLKALETAVHVGRTYVASPDDGAVVDEEARREALRKIYAWLTAWSEIARTVLPRRDHLIRLGIAKRKAPAKKTPVVAPPAPVIASPAPVPAPVAAPVAAPPVPTPAPAVPATPAVPAMPSVPSMMHDVAPDSRAA